MTHPRKARIDALDALRGFALCGILLINIYQTLRMRELPVPVALFVLKRFFVIFSLLFGIGFGLFLDSASARSDRPRLLLLRRLVVLAGFGALHHVLQPGEVLLIYAAFGLLFLLPLSYASPRVNLAVGLVLLVAGMATIGSVALVPGLFVFGLALSSYRVPQTLPERTGLLGLLFAAFTAASAVAYWGTTGPGAGLMRGPVLLGLLPTLMSFAYMAGFLLLLRTPLRGPLTAVFAPLGRMALTNYLMATLIFVPAGRALGLEGSALRGRAIGLSAGILLFPDGAQPGLAADLPLRPAGVGLAVRDLVAARPDTQGGARCGSGVTGWPAWARASRPAATPSSRPSSRFRA
jgi:uncharacterized membrane protein YeiB